MAMKYRSRTEIIVEMLRSASEPTKKTTIMYRSSLTLPQLREYLPFLVEKGLLEFIRETKSYKTTSKGLHTIELFELMGMFIAL
jgi:predicted transcriptional regulator